MDLVFNAYTFLFGFELFLKIAVVLVLVADNVEDYPFLLFNKLVLASYGCCLGRFINQLLALLVVRSGLSICGHVVVF